MLSEKICVQAKDSKIRPRKWVFCFLLSWSLIPMFQAFWWFSAEAIVASALTISGASIGLLASVSRASLRRYPISVMTLVGFIAYYFILPPVATLLEWKPLVNNLIHPEQVLFHALVCLLTLLCAHKLYRRAFFQGWRRTLVARLFVPLGYFRIPSDVQLYLMGLLGLCAMAHQVFVVGAVQGGATGAVDKLIQGLYPLAYLPFCSVVRYLFEQPQSIIASRRVLALALYGILLLGVSLGQNTRSALLIGAASVGLAYLAGSVLSLRRGRVFSLRIVAIVALALIAISGPIADLATSMVIVRDARADSSPGTLVRETVRVFGDKRAISARRIQDNTQAGDWDERYVESVFLSRLANLKYPDNSIDLAERLDDAGSAFLRKMEVQRTLSVFPAPLLEVLLPFVDKSVAGTASGGDLMLFTVTQNPYVLGGYRVGSLFGSGYGMFGWWYLVVLGVFALPIFVIADSQVRDVVMRGSARIQFAPMAVIAMFSWFFFFTSAATGAEAISALPSFLLREWVQALVVYGVAWKLTAPVARALTLGSRTAYANKFEARLP